MFFDTFWSLSRSLISLFANNEQIAWLFYKKARWHFSYQQTMKKTTTEKINHHAVLGSETSIGCTANQLSFHFYADYIITVHYLSRILLFSYFQSVPVAYKVLCIGTIIDSVSTSKDTYPFFRFPSSLMTCRCPILEKNTLLDSVAHQPFSFSTRDITKPCITRMCFYFIVYSVLAVLLGISLRTLKSIL